MYQFITPRKGTVKNQICNKYKVTCRGALNPVKTNESNYLTKHFENILKT